MSAFTPAEIAYLRGQLLARLATVGSNGQPHVVPSVNPWRARGIEIRGVAEILETGGERLMRRFAPQMFRIRPRRIVSWGVEGEGVSRNARSVG